MWETNPDNIEYIIFKTAASDSTRDVVMAIETAAKLTFCSLGHLFPNLYRRTLKTLHLLTESILELGISTV